MSPRKAKALQCLDSDLLSLNALTDEIHKFTAISDRKIVAEYVRNLVSTYLSCSKADKKSVRYRKIQSCTGTMIGFQMLVLTAKKPDAGSMFLFGNEFKGMAPKVNGTNVRHLVQKYRLKLDKIRAPEDGQFKVHGKKVTSLENNPDFTLDVCV